MNVRVLHRLAMARDAGPDHIGLAVQTQADQTRVAKQVPHHGAQRAECERVTRLQLGWQRALFGAGAVVASTEDDGAELAHVFHRQRAPAR
jgi:hypothetical protein